MSLALSGIGVSRGVAIGKAHIIVRGSLEVLESAIPRELIEDEIARFLRAVDAARLQLKNLRDRIPQTTRVDIAAFIEECRHLGTSEEAIQTAEKRGIDLPGYLTDYMDRIGQRPAYQTAMSRRYIVTSEREKPEACDWSIPPHAAR